MPQEEITKLTGLELFHAIASGELPPAPFARLLGIRTGSAEHGRMHLSMRASEWLTSPARTVYGGNVAFFADALMMGAVSTTLPAGSSAATLDLKVHFLRPGIADGEMWDGRGRVVHRGRQLAVTRAEILNADGKPIAIASGSSMVLENRPWQSISVADEPAITSEES